MSKTNIQSNTPTSVAFNGDSITCVETEGAIYVALKPIIERIGLDWGNQFKVVKRDPVLNSTVVELTTVGSDGKTRNMVCLPLSYLNGFLFKIDAALYKEGDPRREIIIKYQMECYQVLFDYWHQGAAINPRDYIAKLNAKTAEMNAKAKAIDAECKFFTAFLKRPGLLKKTVEAVIRGTQSLEDLDEAPTLKAEVMQIIEERGEKLINDVLLKDHPVASAVHRFMKDKEEWRGTATNLMYSLEFLIDREFMEWPLKSITIGSKLRKSLAVLEKVGIRVGFYRSSNKTRDRMICLKQAKHEAHEAHSD